MAFCFVVCAASLIGRSVLLAVDGGSIADVSSMSNRDSILLHEKESLRIPYERCLEQVAMTVSGETKTPPRSFVRIENGVLSIPRETEGFRTKAIKANAFAGNLEIREVRVPSSVAWIGKRAFAGCSNLCSVVMLCGASDSALYDDGVAYIHSEAFMDCTSLTNMVFPARLNAIYEWAYKGCRSLNEAILPPDVIHVSGSTFDACESLRSGDLSLTMDTMLYAFRGCPSLGNIRVSSNNATYAVYDGAVYYKDLRALLRVPPQLGVRTFNVREGTKAICPFAFEDCRIESVTLPDSLVCIGDFAFSSCTNLVSVSIPSRVEEIGNYAFIGCTRLKNVIFMGHRLPKTSDVAFPQHVKISIKSECR